MNISFEKLNYSFKKKPLLVGGTAMEYYGLRKAGDDIDFIADESDVIELIKMYPDRIKDIYSDLGVCPFEFEIWRSIQTFKYQELLAGAVEEDNYLVASLEKLLLLKALAMRDVKYLQDTKLIAKKISDNKYGDYKKEKKKVGEILSNLGNVKYLEKVGSET